MSKRILLVLGVMIALGFVVMNVAAAGAAFAIFSSNTPQEVEAASTMSREELRSINEQLPKYAITESTERYVSGVELRVSELLERQYKTPLLKTRKTGLTARLHISRPDSAFPTPSYVVGEGSWVELPDGIFTVIEVRKGEDSLGRVVLQGPMLMLASELIRDE